MKMIHDDDEISRKIIEKIYIRITTKKDKKQSKKTGPIRKRRIKK